MKRLSAVIVLFATVFTLCACGADSAQEPEASQLKYNDYVYEVLEDGTAKITDYLDTVKLESVDIPKELGGHTVTVIGKGAFSAVQGVTVFNAPESLLTVEDEAFYQCSAREIFFHKSQVTSVGARAFAECPNLIQVDLPRTLESIGTGAFASSVKLLIVYLRCDVQNIDETAFDNCPVVSVHVSDAFTSAIAYCEAHSLKMKIDETESTAKFVYTPPTAAE